MKHSETTRLVQLTHPEKGRKVAMVDEPNLVLLKNITSIYQLALDAIARQQPLVAHAKTLLSEEILDYPSLYEGTTDWQWLPAFDHPENPFACLVSGTGLTHKSSALNRQMMHQTGETKLTDSMQMYQWGLEGGRPPEGKIGVQPEWFYKGSGPILRAHRQPLEIPAYGQDGGEEPEVASVYVVDSQGQPWRVGFCTANEFSDHMMEKKNYLYLAPSKLRHCAIGPELVLDLDFQEIQGSVTIRREGKTLWTKEIHTGEKNMAHSLTNLEYHHFKYETHRIPYQAHVHFLGADAFSFGEKISLQQGDQMEIHWNGMGRALHNTLVNAKETETLTSVRSFG